MRTIKILFFNTIILLLSSIILQIINMFFSIFISNTIGEEAVGVFSLVMSVYMFGITLASAGINISTTYTADAGISAEFLEASLGFEVEGTSTFRIEWEATYSYAVKIRVYPVYEKTTGEVWDDDVWYDDYIGNFTVYRAVGDDVRVYRA